jgi:hypothetical protein
VAEWRSQAGRHWEKMMKGLTAGEAAARINVGKTALYKALQPQS